MTIERRKQAEAPVPSADKRTEPLDRRQRQRDLLDTIDARITSAMMPAENRVAAVAYLLTTLKLADEAETMRLLNCGAGQMKAARKRAEEGVKMRSTLGSLIEQIRTEMEHPSAVPQQQTVEQQQAETPLEKLARAIFVSDPNPKSMARSSQERHAKRAIALIAWNELRDTEEAAKFVGNASKPVFARLLAEARGEYADEEGLFRKKVQAICEELKIPAPF